jgi:hypothetical protein
MAAVCLVGVSGQLIPATAAPRASSRRGFGKPPDAMAGFDTTWPHDPAWLRRRPRVVSAGIGFGPLIPDVLCADTRAVPLRHGGRRPAIHDFSDIAEESRGCPAPRHSPRAGRDESPASTPMIRTSDIRAVMPAGIDPSQPARIDRSTQDSSVSLCLCGESCIGCRVPGPGPLSSMRYRKLHHKGTETRRRQLCRRRAIRFGLSRRSAQAWDNADASHLPARRLSSRARIV